jgi:hypothetical protein
MEGFRRIVLLIILFADPFLIQINVGLGDPYHVLVCLYVCVRILWHKPGARQRQENK